VRLRSGQAYWAYTEGRRARESHAPTIMAASRAGVAGRRGDRVRLPVTGTKRYAVGMWRNKPQPCKACGHGKTIHVKVPREPRWKCRYVKCKCKNYEPR
jgi:hypothetical protein